MKNFTCFTYLVTDGGVFRQPTRDFKFCRMEDNTLEEQIQTLFKKIEKLEKKE